MVILIFQIRENQIFSYFCIPITVGRFALSIFMCYIYDQYEQHKHIIWLEVPIPEQLRNAEEQAREVSESRREEEMEYKRIIEYFIILC